MKKHTYTAPGGVFYNLHNDIMLQNHVLIAGMSGAGKSVLLNGCIYSALADRFPFDAPGGMQLVLIDPKRCELDIYKRLPHCIGYADDVPGAVALLRSAVEICDARNTINKQRGERIYTGGDIYIIIDELADLMTTAKKQVLPLLQRLGQVGRSARIHILAATQCPLSAVIPTPLKVNFSATIGLHTRSRQDSRNITGAAGLETLPMHGTGLYIKPGADDTLYQIPFITDEELQARAEFWARQTEKKRLFDKRKKK